MNESDIIDKIKEYLKTIEGCFYWKEHGGMYGQKGIPDIICCYKGKFIAFEVKTETGKVSVLQEITLRKIRSAGGEAVVVRSVDEVKAVIQKLR